VTRTFAIIPAAGKSERMGRPKLALPLGGRPILERTIESLMRAGVKDIGVIIGPQAPELVEIAEAAGAEALMLDCDTPDMRTTLMLGLHWLKRSRHPGPDDRILLVPGDHPVFSAEVIRRLESARATAGDRSIVVPTFGGVRGHPVLFDWKHVGEMENWPVARGFNSYFRSQPDATVELPVNTPAILWDLDTPEDYERMLREYNVLDGGKTGHDL
jgi:molybdenum cofactor cytidylyltransferase